MPASRKHPILTILSGPNGSGKSTLGSRLMLEGAFGVLVNADEIARSMDHRKGEAVPGKETQWEAAVSAEQMRWTLLSQRIDFMTETVMSDGDRWIRFLAAAKEAGYKIVMYFVTTADPAINVLRVSERVQAGGHAVDPEKIVARYKRVMEEVLPKALEFVDEAILFDNSDPESGLVGIMQLKAGIMRSLVEPTEIPSWAKAVAIAFQSLPAR